MATAVTLTAGLTTLASAAGSHQDADALGPLNRVAPAVGGVISDGSADGLEPNHRITLITGDRVLVDGRGRVAGFEPAKGRERIPAQTRTVNGHTLVIPIDARPLVESGKLDRRLFDVTELSKPAYRKAHKNGLRVIVAYQGAATEARASVRSVGDTRVRRTLKSLNAEAITASSDDGSHLWNVLTGTSTRGLRTPTTGISRIWLDGLRTATLDKSVSQIGAPAVWAAGYDGKGVKIAVLDTGVDTTHPDLKTQVIAEKNFTTAADVKDRHGHGTHVASIAAGTGAKAGAYRGVAPGATLLSGKVLDDRGGGDDSTVIAGIDWAVQQGADIVNLSLGGRDFPGVDALEAQVNQVSADRGVLFAVAAGNDGPYGLNSPGTADAALTVGAVDDTDGLAGFSSVGPRLGDGAIKPDVTGPGVDITAAAAPGSVIEQSTGQQPDGYLTISGTSMATPHVAGAAALLKQRHPHWTDRELKAALTGSTKSGPYTPFEQGSGRIQADRALQQTVIADPVALGFGVAQWPHTDDTPLTRAVTYRNLGTEDITLELKATGLDPQGGAAPAGFFTLSSSKVTVPAGGKATVDLTVDTRLGGAVNGVYSAYVTASGAGQTVRTAAAVEREVESYELTVKHIGRDGATTQHYSDDIVGIEGAARDKGVWKEGDPSGMTKVRLPKGTYVLNTDFSGPDDQYRRIDWITQPKLNLSADTALTVDARTTGPVDIKVPDPTARSILAAPDFSVTTADDYQYGFGWVLDTYDHFHRGQLGPRITDGSLREQWEGHWLKADSTSYHTIDHEKVQRLSTGYTKRYKAHEFATVKALVGASAPKKQGLIAASGRVPGPWGAWIVSKPLPKTLPATTTLHLSTEDQVTWDLGFDQFSRRNAEGAPIIEMRSTLAAAQRFTAGRTYPKKFNVGVFGPRIGGRHGVHRDGDMLFAQLPLFVDGQSQPGASAITSAKTTLYRGSTKIAENTDPLQGEPLAIPPEHGDYRLTSSVIRPAQVSRVSTRIDTTWSFSSKRTAELTKLPASTAYFGTALGPDSTAPARRTQSVAVHVQGAAAGGNLASLAVYASYDHGKNWKKLTVTQGKVSVRNPDKGQGISFHAKIVDRKGNQSTVSIFNAYLGK